MQFNSETDISTPQCLHQSQSGNKMKAGSYSQSHTGVQRSLSEPSDLIISLEEEKRRVGLNKHPQNTSVVPSDSDLSHAQSYTSAS